MSAEVVKPLSDRPYEGFVNLTTEISPMASAVYEAGRSVNTGSPAWRGDPLRSDLQETGDADSLSLFEVCHAGLVKMKF